MFVKTLETLLLLVINVQGSGKIAKIILIILEFKTLETLRIRAITLLKKKTYQD